MTELLKRWLHSNICPLFLDFSTSQIAINNDTSLFSGCWGRFCYRNRNTFSMWIMWCSLVISVVFLMLPGTFHFKQDWTISCENWVRDPGEQILPQDWFTPLVFPSIHNNENIQSSHNYIINVQSFCLFHFWFGWIPTLSEIKVEMRYVLYIHWDFYVLYIE